MSSRKSRLIYLTVFRDGECEKFSRSRSPASMIHDRRVIDAVISHVRHPREPGTKSRGSPQEESSRERDQSNLQRVHPDGSARKVRAWCDNVNDYESQCFHNGAFTSELSLRQCHNDLSGTNRGRSKNHLLSWIRASARSLHACARTLHTTHGVMRVCVCMCACVYDSVCRIRVECRGSMSSFCSRLRDCSRTDFGEQIARVNRERRVQIMALFACRFVDLIRKSLWRI